LLLPVKDKFQHFTLFLNPSGTATVLAPAISLDARLSSSLGRLDADLSVDSGRRADIPFARK
jgi:hypothetical protein